MLVSKWVKRCVIVNQFLIEFFLFFLRDIYFYHCNYMGVRLNFWSKFSTCGVVYNYEFY